MTGNERGGQGANQERSGADAVSKGISEEYQLGVGDKGAIALSVGCLQSQWQAAPKALSRAVVAPKNTGTCWKGGTGVGPEER